MTVWRWARYKKIRVAEFGGILFISYATIQSCRVKRCANCYHATDSICTCRELADKAEGCADWQPIELRS